MDSPKSNGDGARRLSTVERAYELARSGSCRTIEEIARQLKSERQEAVDAHLGGSSIRRDLRQICAESRMQRLREHDAEGAAE
jgi:hypothetical protein